jgi:hypothetical protein
MNSSKLIILVLLVLICSCSNNENNLDLDKKKTNTASIPFEEMAKNEAMTKLRIPMNEEFAIEIYKAHLNQDEIEDAIITINRLDFAIEEASKSKNSSQIAAFGYLGKYNYFMFYDGKLEKFSVPILVSSSAKKPLKIKFEHVESDFFQNVIVEYRVRNAAFQNFYRIHHNSMNQMFQWKIFDSIGHQKPFANYIEYGEGSISLSKDILIYEGKIKNYNKNIENHYLYEPEIEKNGKLLYRFFFDPKTGEYYTENKKRNP